MQPSKKPYLELHLPHRSSTGILFLVLNLVLLPYNFSLAQENISRQPIQIPDLKIALELTEAYLKMIKSTQFTEAFRNYHVFLLQPGESEEKVVQESGASLQALFEQLGGLYIYSYSNFKLDEVREWIPGKNNPGTLKFMYGVTCGKAKALLTISLIKFNNSLKIRDIELSDLKAP